MVGEGDDKRSYRVTCPDDELFTMTGIWIR